MKYGSDKFPRLETALYPMPLREGGGYIKILEPAL